MPASAYETVTEQLYVAYFGRPADAAGLASFEAVLANDGAPTDIQSLASVYASSPAIQILVNSFSGSAEANALYGGSTTAQFVTSVYQNVLGRAPAAAGLSYWSNAIDSGQLSKGDAALAVMAGALANTTAAGQIDAQLVNNRIAVASQFTADVASPTGLAGYRGAVAALSARSMLSAVTASTDLQAYSAAVTALAAQIAANTYYINVTVSGLSVDDTLVLQNGSDSLTLTSNISARFAVPQINGSAYAVSAASLPPEVECDISGGSGTGSASSPANVSVSCHNIHVYVFYNYSTFFDQYTLQPDYSLKAMAMPSVPVLGGDYAVMVDGDGHHAYLADHNDNVLQQLSFDANWNLLPMSVPSVPSGSYPYALAMDPQSRYAYAADEGGGGISQYTVGANGSLTPMPVPTVSASVGPRSVTIEPSGKYLYAAGGSEVLAYSIGTGGGLVKLPSTLSTVSPVEDALADRSGKYVYVATNPGVISQYAIGPDGSLSLVASVTADPVYNDQFKLFIDPLGKHLYAIPKEGLKAYQFAIGASGALTPLMPAYISVPASWGAMGMDPSGRYIFLVDFSSNILYEYGIGSTGALSLLNTVQLASGDTAGAVLVY
ncbi:MAG TPA: DUF4214 domain-containing protein [Burkholderiaceae bacterium]